ncbi:restriction endonuclease subunit S [Bacillus altitudinis]|uniref:restriction endonuclease subunit S n=1 Tax=Bacillus altitudinis TaxID=293387 RepID=UPI0009ACA227|nr:restriction endonuclease subunit S [Bacillus altitudinis]MBR0631434.1 hypothetical protein [Bacillus altitudinis C101]MBY0185485.1 restriction endonuclease subunit S [Bacillus aerophilus]OPW93735.1 hypothetical protein BG911_15020 [Bacillus altitudinis]
MSKYEKTTNKLVERFFVPLDKQPYKLPENWEWIRLDELCSIKTGKLNANAADENGAFPFFTCSKDIYKINEFAFDGEAILLAGNGDFNVKYYSGKFNAYQRTYVLQNFMCYGKYLFLYLLCTLDILTSNNRGSTIKYIRLSDLQEHLVCLPPINEQKRIAEKVELLLDKIEEAKQLIEEAKETFELRRASILDKAFRGELSRKWRRTNVNIEDAEILYSKIKQSKRGKRKKTKEINVDELRYIIPSNWKWVRLGDVFTITSGGTPKRTVPEFYAGNIPWVKTGEIKWNYIYESVEKITPDAIANSSAKILPKNSVLVAMYGQGLTRGRASILGVEATCNQAVCALLPNDYILPDFLYYYFMEGYQRFRQIAKGGNQENLSATVISEFIFPLPPLEEQGVIVDIVQSIFTKESMMQEVIEMNIDHLKQSILSKAFRGELGTSDPSEENAIELLKEVLQEQVK